MVCEAHLSSASTKNFATSSCGVEAAFFRPTKTAIIIFTFFISFALLFYNEWHMFGASSGSVAPSHCIYED
jgi:hypothetical protein